MKQLSCLLCLLLGAIQATAQTTITTNITANTTWTLAGSPYLITANNPVTISPNVTLTIEPGVVVKHNNATWYDLLVVNGTLIAVGTADQPIVFTDIKDDQYGGDSNNDGGTTSPQVGDWGGIRLNPGTGAASKFAHCLFRFGGDQNTNAFDGTLEVTGGAPVVENCTFTNCENGLTITTSNSFEVKNCSFLDGAAVPIAIGLNAAPIFSNLFFNNKINGIGLIALSYATPGASYTLKQQNVGGFTNIPYIIYDDPITIGSGVTLTIEPGVIVKHSNLTWYDLFVINGTLIAEGTASQPIVFTDILDDQYGGDSNNDGSTTSPKAGDWGGIRLNPGNNPTSRFAHCLFRYGGDQNTNAFDGTLEITGGAPVIDNCSFTNCENGLTITSSTGFNVKNCSFLDCTVIPVAVGLNAAPIFSDIVFNNKINGIGLIPLAYTTSGASYTLKRQNVGGIANIPYIIYGDPVTIGSGVTLTIEPGVIVKHSYLTWYDLFVVNGTLVAEGTASQPIVFTDVLDDQYGGDTNNDGSATSSKAGDWGGIRLNAGSGAPSKFAFCLFRFGGDKNTNAFDGTLEVTGGAPVVENCTFTSCEHGLMITTISSFNVTNCSFINCATIPVAIALNAAPVFSNLVFNNKINGIGLLPLTYNGVGAAYTLKKQNIGGVTNFPYIIYDNPVTIGSGVTLTIQPGVIVKHSYLTWYDMFVVNGTLIAAGTADQPIVFTDIHDDQYGGDSNNNGSATSPKAGDWGGVRLNAGSGAPSRLEHCLFRFGGDQNSNAFDAALEITGGAPMIRFANFETCQTGISNIVSTGSSVRHCAFKNCDVGILNDATNQSNPFVIDSVAFSNNKVGVRIANGSVTASQSSFVNSSQYHIENLSAQDVNARENWWGIVDYLAMLQNPAINLAKIYDKKDNAAKGLVDVSNPTPPARGIWSVSPNQAVLVQGIVSVTVQGYPIQTGAKITLRKSGANDILLTGLTYTNIAEMKGSLVVNTKEPGLYDVIITNPGGDTISQQNAFSILDTPTLPFGQWIPFEVKNGNVFAGGIAVPSVENLFVLLKKSDRVGYANTWRGKLTLNKDGKDVAVTDGFQSIFGGSYTDFDYHRNQPLGGYYTFEVETTDEKGKGFILFTSGPDTLSLGNWEKGEILRPYGYDWKVLFVPSGIDTLFLKTEGFGLWSTLEAFKDSLGSKEKWLFDNPGSGYSIQGKIPHPKEGYYILRYKDSAVLQSNNSGSLYTNQPDQKREYLIRADGNTITTLPPGRKITHLSTDSIAQTVATFEVKGNGFRQQDQVFLRKTGMPDYQALVRSIAANGRSISVEVDASALPLGQYQLYVKDGNAQDIVDAPNPFYIVNDQKPDIWVDILGPAKIRVGRTNTFQVRYGNDGNVDAENVFIYLKAPLNTLQEIKLPKSYTYSKDTLVDRVINYVHVYAIPAHTTGQFDITVKTQAVGTLEMEIGYVDSLPILFPDLFLRPGNASKSSVMPMAEFQANPAPGEQVFQSFSLIPGVLPATPLPAHVGTYVEEGGQGYVIDYTTDSHVHKTPFETWKDNRYIGAAHPPFGWTLEKGQQIAQEALNTHKLYNPSGNPVNYKHYFGIPFLDDQANCNTFTKAVYKKAGVDYWSNLAPVSNYLEWNAVNGITKGLEQFNNLRATHIPPLKNQGDLWNNFDSFFKDFFKGNPFRILSDILGSTTPEDKFGPLAYDTSDRPLAERKGFISERRNFNYRIDYWNKETATAPAAEVFIRDTLDKDFDLTTFNFTEFGFLRWRIPVQGQYFNATVDLRPDMNLLVHVEGTLNPFTREVYWVHRSLDPRTLDLPDDPLAGYLPPIDSNGYNLGWVSFSVQPKSDLPSKTELTNQARVNFDGIGPWGPAPPYGPYRNTYDFDAPTSSIESLSPTNGTAFLLNWSGSDDAGAGIRSYDIYVSKDGDPYIRWLSDTSATTALFAGQDGHSYQFYSVATDQVGNKEEPPASPDASTMIVGYGQVAVKKEKLTLSPNPAETWLNIQFQAEPLGETVNISDVNGKVVYKGTLMSNNTVVPIDGWLPGLYVVSVVGKNGRFVNRFVKL